MVMSLDFDATNDQILDLVISRIQDNLSSYFRGLDCDTIDIVRGPLAIDYWSFTFSVDIVTSTFEKKGVYIKIPRKNWNDKRIINAIRDPEARRAGELEYHNLLRLHYFTSGLPEDYNSIRPLDYLADVNAILTEKVYGNNLIAICRNEDLRRLLLGGRGNNPSEGLLYKCGRWLRYFHEGFSSKAEARFSSKEVINKIMAYSQKIKQTCTNYTRLEGLLARFVNLDVEGESFIAPTLEGFEIWNIIVENGKIYLLDPGEIGEGPILEDIAHFLVSLEILYWGMAWFLLKLKPRQTYVVSFLQGYFEDDPLPDQLLRCFIIKELFRQWHDAHIVLEEAKSYPKLLDWFLRRFYIDDFYFQEITRHLRLLEAQQ